MHTTGFVTGTRRIIPNSKWPGESVWKSTTTLRKQRQLAVRLYTQLRNFCLHICMIALFCVIANHDLITHSFRQNTHLKHQTKPVWTVSLNYSSESNLILLIAFDHLTILQNKKPNKNNIFFCPCLLKKGEYCFAKFGHSVCRHIGVHKLWNE